MKKFIAAFFCLFAFPAFAGTLTLLGVGSQTESGPPEFSYLASYTGSSGSATLDISSVGFGDANSKRRIVVGIRSGSTLTGITIGGETGIVNYAISGYAYGSALVPSGTSGTVSMTFSGAPSSTRIWVTRAVNLSSGSVTDTYTSAGTSTSRACSIDILQDGFMLGIWWVSNDATSHSWSGGVTKNSQSSFSSGSLSFASYVSPSDQTKSTTASYAGFARSNRIFCASWR